MSESDFHRSQIVTSKVGPRIEWLNRHQITRSSPVRRWPRSDVWQELRCGRDRTCDMISNFMTPSYPSHRDLAQHRSDDGGGVRAKMWSYKSRGLPIAATKTWPASQMKTTHQNIKATNKAPLSTGSGKKTNDGSMPGEPLTISGHNWACIWSFCHMIENRGSLLVWCWTTLDKH